MRMKTLKGSSLPTVMVICVLISLLVLFAIALFDMNNLFYANYHAGKQRKEDINSAFVVYCNDSTLTSLLDREGGYQLYEGDDASLPVHFEIQPWGLYECVTVYTADHTYHSTRLLGKKQDCEYEAALWVCSRDMVLSFAGRSEIKGTTFIPINGISYIQLGDIPFEGKEIRDEYIDLSEVELPPIDTAYIKRLETCRKRADMAALPAKKEADPYYSFRDPTVHFDLADHSGPLCVRGNAVLHADEITLTPEDVLSDVILSARKVTIEEGFAGSLQIMATDTVIIKEHVQLRYPSGVYLEGNDGMTYLEIGNHSQLNGYAIVFGTTEKSSGIHIDENYRQDSTAVFRGLLYVDGIADVRGELSGGVYLTECYYLPENGVYASVLKDARISRNNQMVYPLFFAHSAYRRKEIKTIH